jgi:hypothetical protein
MSLREKFAGGTGGTRAPVTDGGGNYHAGAASHASRMYAHLSPSTAGTSSNRVEAGVSLGDKASTAAISSHNDINRFTSGISMHHPYKNRGGAFDENKRMYQGSNAKRSDFRTPSGGGTGSRAGRKMGVVKGSDNYNNPRMENRMPADPSKGGGSPSGPRGGTRALMNRMKKAGVNKMGKKW